MTLVEIMVVVVIMSLVTSIVSIAVVQAMTRARIKAAKVQIANIRDGLELFRVHYRHYPSMAEGLDALAASQNGEPPIMSSVPKDSWGHDFVYVVPGQHDARGFDLSSLGPDETAGTEDDIGTWNLNEP